VDLKVEQFRVPPGGHFRLADVDPDTARHLRHRRGLIEAEQAETLTELRYLHERLWAQQQQALLIVLLAIDTGGKDSTVDRIFSGINPQGCRVVSFGVPSTEERAHDYLWRVHYRVPRRGMIGIFNRSHYEDVTVVRVNGAIDGPECERRYQHIRAFERMLHETGTYVLKFHLRISKDEQARRLRDRLEDPAKHWKFDPQDLIERERWDEHHAAFEDAINATATMESPWYVVPANSKWFRDAVVTRVIVERLRQMDPHFPPPVEDLEQYTVT
jgi:PPK2 family polyphosphate:nucleotide phosphotransferase